MGKKIASEKLETVRAIDGAIRSRKTMKCIANQLPPVKMKSADIARLDDEVLAAVKVAGWAPFHYDRRIDGIAEPWRFDVFFHDACRQTSERFAEWFADVKPGNKLPGMLNACGACVLVSWLPEEDSQNPKLEKVNQEHQAATSAAVQNLLLALEVRGLGTYWSSGGQLGTPELWNRIGVNPNRRLVGAIFVHYPGLVDEESLTVVAGKNREKRSDWKRWTRVIRDLDRS